MTIESCSNGGLIFDLRTQAEIAEAEVARLRLQVRLLRRKLTLAKMYVAKASADGCFGDAVLNVRRVLDRIYAALDMTA